LIRAVPLYDESGRVVKWYGQNTDIEDRKRAETLLSGEKRLGEVLYEPGDQAAPFVVVTMGQIEIVRPSSAGDTLITALGPGQARIKGQR
jgi:CRP-like cAMP-binding protein